jgi:hypothetical protein
VADYTPPYVSGDVATSTASTAITGGALLVVSGSGTVAPFTPGAAPALNIIGVAAADALSGARVSYYGVGPQHESIADGTVTAGDQLVSATNAGRQVRTLVPSAGDLGASFVQAAANLAFNLGVNNARSVLGIALTTAPDNTKVRWIMTFA